MVFDKNKLRITPASFIDAKRLERSIAKALTNSSLNIGVDNIDKKEILNSKISEGTFGEVIKSFLHIIISEEVENCLFECCKTAIYDNEKINIDFFSEVEKRKLYYPIMIETIKVNVYPFIESLFSQFGGLLEKAKSILK